MSNLDFDMPQNQAATIKVIGVGGGGSNAVNYMYEKGIRGVDFIVCNTDQQALDDSPVPTKIQLGVSITEGLGAGADPQRGKFAAEENIADVIAVLECNTKMVFINAGMGGGTGTGAAPIIAQAAKKLDILTVAIVTIPFVFEGRLRMAQAKSGIEELKQHVDSLIVINNNKLREIYGNLGFKSGFAKADEILATASRGIAEVITQTGHLNIDLNDARMVLANSGTALMGTGTASGKDRSIKAVKGAIESPLLDNNHIRGAKKVLLLIVSGAEEVTFEEMGEISDFIQEQVMIDGGSPADIIMGLAEDEELGDAINVTVVATGFHEGKVVNPITGIPVNVVHELTDEVAQTIVLTDFVPTNLPKLESKKVEVRHFLEEDVENSQSEEITNYSQSKIESQSQVSMTFDLEIDSNELTPESPVDYQIESDEPSFIITEEQNDEDVVLEESLVDDSHIELHEKVVFNLENNPAPEENVIANVDLIEDAGSGKIVHTLHIDDENEFTDINSKKKIIEEEMELSSFSNCKTLAEHQVTNTIEDNEVVEEEGVNDSDTEIEIIDSEVVTNKCTMIIDDIDNSLGTINEQTVLSSHSDTVQEQIERAQKRKDRLQKFNYRFRNNSLIDKVEREPAYKRQGVEINNTLHSKEETLSRIILSSNEDGEIELKSRNTFLHDNVD